MVFYDLFDKQACGADKIGHNIEIQNKRLLLEADSCHDVEDDQAGGDEKDLGWISR